MTVLLSSAPSWGFEPGRTQDIEHTRMRARDLGLFLGFLQTGPLNAITDVPA